MSNTPTLTSMTTSDLAEVLLCWGLQESDRPPAELGRAASRDRIGACGGDSSGCVALVAQEAGDHPEIYRARMRWALSTVSRAYRGLGTAAA